MDALMHMEMGRFFVLDAIDQCTGGRMDLSAIFASRRGMDGRGRSAYAPEMMGSAKR